MFPLGLGGLSSSVVSLVCQDSKRVELHIKSEHFVSVAEAAEGCHLATRGLLHTSGFNTILSTVYLLP